MEIPVTLQNQNFIAEFTELFRTFTWNYICYDYDVYGGRYAEYIKVLSG